MATVQHIVDGLDEIFLYDLCVALQHVPRTSFCAWPAGIKDVYDEEWMNVQPSQDDGLTLGRVAFATLAGCSVLAETRRLPTFSVEMAWGSGLGADHYQMQTTT